MVKIQHNQTGETRDVSRTVWETGQEYQRLRKLWSVLEEGDPVTVIWIGDTGEETELGLFDRDHAIRMIKANNKRCYIKPDEKAVSESELINKVLQDASAGQLVSTRDTPEDYHKALLKAIARGLIEKRNMQYSLSEPGRIALDMGFDKWLERKTQKEQYSKSNTIAFHGPVTGAVVNQGSEFRDLNNLSPIIKNEPQEAHPTPSPIKKSDHAIWDKIKYISVIIGGIAALVVAGSKIIGLW
jgi:membrane carboxypeptidase/penicillin-binding protein PbpC